MSTTKNQYQESVLKTLRKCYDAAYQQRERDTAVPNPITGAPLKNPWYYYERLYRGFQYDFMKPTASWVSLPVTNKIYTGVEAYATMLCDTKPAITIVPREPSDQRTADIAKAGLAYWWDTSGMELTTHVAVKSSRIFGIGWLHTYYDDEKDTVVCRAVHPQHILVDPDATVDNFDPTYLIYEYRAQFGALRSMYEGNELPDGTTVDFNNASRNPNWNISTYLGSDSPDDRVGDPISPSTSVNVYELWIKDPETVVFEQEEDGVIVTLKKRKYPNGRRIIVACGMILDDRPNPYKHGEFPFTPVHAYIVPGRFYSFGDVQMAMNIQISRNRLSQMILDQTYKSGGGWMFLGMASGLKPDQITQGPFNIVPCKSVEHIRVERPPAPSRHIIEFLSLLDADFDDVMGIHEISRGAALTSHKTQAEIMVMAESDRTRVRQAARNLVFALRRVARQVMWNLAQFHKGSWFVRIAGDPKAVIPGAEDEGPPKFQEVDFNGKMFLNVDGDDLKYDIVFADDATLPNAQSQTYDKVAMLLNMGVITPLDVLKYKLIDVPYADQIYMDRMAEIEKMEGGNQQPGKQPEQQPEGEAGAQGEEIPPELLNALLAQSQQGMMPQEAMVGQVPPEAMTGQIPPVPPEVLMQQMQGVPVAGDPMADIAAQQQMAPQDIEAMLSQGAAGGVGQQMQQPIDIFSILGSMPEPEGGVDQDLINAMSPIPQDMTPEQLLEIASMIAERYNLSVDDVYTLLLNAFGLEKYKPSASDVDDEDEGDEGVDQEEDLEE